MKKYIVFFVALAVAFSFSITAGLANNTGPKEMVLKTEEAKKPAIFPHEKHQQMEGNTCGTCHHSKDADGKQAAYVEGQKIESCTTCHNADMANEKLNSFKNAAHELCQGCHKEKKAAGMNAPTMCTGCHLKDLK